jgi:hypothetical protein
MLPVTRSCVIFITQGEEGMKKLQKKRRAKVKPPVELFLIIGNLSCIKEKSFNAIVM